MKTEEFPVSRDVVEGLIKVLDNGENNEGDKRDRTVYVNLSMVRLQMAWVMPKLLYARAVADKLSADVYVICWRENELFEKLLNNMGMKFLCLEKLLRKNIPGAVSAIVKTTAFMITDGSGAGLKKLRYSKVGAGKYLYEDIIRTSSLSTIRSARNRICLKKMLHILWMCSSLDSYLKKHKPSFAVVDDLAYHEAIIICLFKKHGAKLRNVSTTLEEEVFIDEKGEPVRRGGWVHDCIAEQLDEVDDAAERAEELLALNFAGISGRSIDRGAFKGKEIFSREELTKQLGLDPSKKNAVIMAHTFTDAVFNYGDIYFRDYYDWLEQTLRIAEGVDNVNWILKPHPTRKAYNEDTDSIEKMYERHKKPHIFLLPDKVSGGSIKELADVLLTIGGNAGAEFACFGIPAVIVGKPYYRGFGFTIEPADINEYEKTLKDIAAVSPLSQDQIVTARKVYYYKKKGRRHNERFDDELAQGLSELYTQMQDKMAVSYFESNKGTKEYNDMVCRYLCDYFTKNGIKENEYYKRGMQRGDELI